MNRRHRVSLIPLLGGILLGGLSGPSVLSFQSASPAATAVDAYGDPLPAGARARLGTVRLRHAGVGHIHGVSVTCLAYAPDGTRVASGGGDGTVRIWDVATGKELHRLRGHQGPVSSVVFSPDGTLVASGGGDRMVASRQGIDGDKTVRLWEAASGTEIRILRGHDRRVTAVAFSPNGRILASGSLDGTVRLWTAATGESLPSLVGYKGGISALTFTKDGAAVATTDGTHHLRIVDLPSGGELSTRVDRVNIPLKGRVGAWPNGDVSSFGLSPDGTTAVTVDGLGFSERSLQLWNLPSAKELPVRFEASLERPSVPYEAIFSPDGKILAVRGGAGSLSLWDAAAGRKLHDLRGHSYDVSAFAFSPDGKLLVSGSDDRTVRFWDTSTGKEIVKVDGHEAWVEAIDFSPDGKTVVTAAGDSTIRFWSPESGRPTDVLRQPTTQNWSCRLKFSPDGSVVVSTGMDGAIHFWDAAARRYRKAFRSLASEHGGGPIGAIALAPDGRTIAESGLEVIRLLDAVSGKEERRFAGSPGSVSSMAYTPDGRLLWTVGMLEAGSKQSVLHAWDPRTGRKLAVAPFPEPFARALAVSPDGSLVATVAVGARIRLWEGSTAREVLSWAGPEKGSRSVAFSPGGAILATGGEDGIVRLWRVSDGIPVAALEGHAEYVSSLAFSPDGRTLASASGDTTALLWQVPSPEAPAPAGDVSGEEGERLWSDLADVSDVARAYRAVVRLQSHGASTAALLRERLFRPALSADRLRDLLQGLDHSDASVREHSTAELLGSGEERMLRAIPADGLGPESRGRLEAVLNDFESPLSKSPSIVRAIRAVRILEVLGTKETRSILRDLAREEPPTRPAREAQAALSRLGEKK